MELRPYLGPYYTHGGSFHCDELAGWEIVKGARICDTIVRLTNLDNIPSDGLVADIGREYDHSKNRYDHHQEMMYRENGVPYASAGLLWSHYGDQYIYYVAESIGVSLSYSEIVEILHDVDKKIIQGIDAGDSSSTYLEYVTCEDDLEVNCYTLSSVVRCYNLYGSDSTEEDQLEAFLEAGKVVSQCLVTAVKGSIGHLENIKVVQDESEAYFFDHLLVFNKSFPWIRATMEQSPETQFVILPSDHPANKFSLMAVPKVYGKRGNQIDIERSPDFKGFIHIGKFIAASNDVQELIDLAYFNLNNA